MPSHFEPMTLRKYTRGLPARGGSPPAARGGVPRRHLSALARWPGSDSLRPRGHAGRVGGDPRGDALGRRTLSGGTAAGRGSPVEGPRGSPIPRSKPTGRFPHGLAAPPHVRPPRRPTGAAV